MNARLLITITVLAMFSAICSAALAQNAPASAVQLPTFGYNTVNTTVSVPDRGGVYMGGINRSSSGRTESGAPLLPFKNRSIGNQTSATSFSSHVYIHDFEAMDEAALNAGAAAISNGAGGPAIVNGNKTIPFRYADTQPQPQRKAVNPNQVSVRKRTKSANKTDEPLVLTGRRTKNAAVLGNIKDSLE